MSFLSLLMLLFTMHDVYPVTESPDADGTNEITIWEDLANLTASRRPLKRTKRSSGSPGHLAANRGPLKKTKRSSDSPGP